MQAGVSAATRYRVAGAQVIHETIDGEVVIINLASGSYFSLDGAGVGIWEGILDGASADALVAAVLARYDGDEWAVRAAIDDLLAALVAEGLIGPDESAASEPDPILVPGGGPRAPFSPPVLRTYTDMQELISLDPIHEVDEAGWPHRRQEAHAD